MPHKPKLQSKRGIGVPKIELALPLQRQFISVSIAGFTETLPSERHPDRCHQVVLNYRVRRYRNLVTDAED